MKFAPRFVLQVGSLLLVACSAWAAEQVSQCAKWDLWETYSDRFIQPDGRVVEFSADARTTSEGQAYALFFALVANDRRAFERVLTWTEDNLVQGRLGDRLPAWLWGHDGQGGWRVLDPNAASDADLWLAYALLEAGRLWTEPEFTARARALMERIEESEVVCLPGLGPMLLPGPYGFRLDETTWRFNPSYLPLQLLRALAEEDPAGPWERLAENTLTMLQAIAPKGLVADWVAYEEPTGFISDPIQGPVGSFDAIRVYLWAGMLDKSDRLAGALLKAIAGMHQLVDRLGAPPMYVDSLTGIPREAGPEGFSAALLPYLEARGDRRQLAVQRQRVLEAKFSGLVGALPLYYDQNLALFGEGAFEGRIRFARNGQLIPRWIGLCQGSLPQDSS
ncbi:MAG: cellulose synthase complex periplasmic endoglucanase BcsZ [Gammaproteobacteria bacterium]